MKNDTRERLINALKEISTICESRERCDNDCMFAQPLEFYGGEVYGCEIMGFVDSFGECHVSDDIKVNPEYIVDGLEEMSE